MHIRNVRVSEPLDSGARAPRPAAGRGAAQATCCRDRPQARAPTRKMAEARRTVGGCWVGRLVVEPALVEAGAASRFSRARVTNHLEALAIKLINASTPHHVESCVRRELPR